MTTGGGAGGRADVLYIDVEARLERFESRLAEMERSAERAGERTGSKLGAAMSTGLKVATGAAVGLGLAVLGAVPAMQELAGEAAKADATNQMFAKTLERFKVPAKEAEAAVSDLSTKLGVAPEIIREGMTTILRAGGTLEDATRTITAAGASAAAAGGDIGNAVANASQAIAMGRSELLESAGIMTNASDAYESYAKSIGKSVKELTEAQKIEAFSKAVYKESKYEIADLSVIMGGYAGQQARAAQVNRELRQVIGQLVLPVVTALGEVTGDVAQATLKWLQGLDKEKIASFGGVIKQVAGAVKDGLVTGFNTAKVVVFEVGAAFQKTSAFVERHKEILIPLAAGIGTVTGALAIHKAATIAATAITTAWTAATTAATAASVALRAAIAFITGPVGLAVAAITALVAAGVYLYRNWDEVKARALAIWGQIKEIVSNAVGGAVAYLRGLDMKSVGLFIVQGLVNGILAGPRLVLSAARGLGSAVISGIKGILNIQSPSKETWILGEHAVEGFAGGITRTTPLAQKAAAGLGGVVLSELEKARQELERGLAYDAWVEGLRELDDSLLQVEGTQARALGQADRYNAVLAEQGRRAGEAAQAVSDLADEQIRAANSRYADTQGATDSAYRQTYGAGDEGLIRSLVAITGFSVGKVRADVQGALDEAKKHAPQVVAIIERVWADALAHRRGVAEEEKRVNAAILASDEETSRARTGAIAEVARAEGEAADDAAITVQSLTGMIRELVSQGRDPGQTGFTDWLDELIQKGGQAGGAAAYVKKNLDSLVELARFSARVPTPEGGPVDARPSRPTPEEVTPSAARPAPQAPMTETTARGATLSPEDRAWQESVAVKGLVDEYRTSLKGLTGVQLEQAKAAALAAGNQERYNLIVEEGDRRAKVAADSTKLILEAETELHTILTGETIPAYEARARALEEQAEKDKESAGRLRELAAAIRETGRAAEENAQALNLTVRIGGIDTGIRALDLFKDVALGVANVVQGVFHDLASGAEVTAGGVLKSFASMTLGIIRSVATSIIAIQAQIIATQILNLVTGLGTFNPVALAKAAAIALAAAAVAGIASGLESRLSARVEGVATTASSSTSAPVAQRAASDTNSNVNIPTSQVTVMATPEWVTVMASAAREFREGVAEFREVNRRGLRVQVDVPQAANNLAYDLATGGL